MVENEHFQCSVEKYEAIAYFERLKKSKQSKNLAIPDDPLEMATSERITRIVPIQKWTIAEFSLYLQELYKWGYPLQTVLLDLTYFGKLPDQMDFLLFKPPEGNPCPGVIEYLRFVLKGNAFEAPQGITLNQLVTKVPEISKGALMKKRYRK